ncbi:cobyrinate a,c-diamide synthase [Hahella ganghwensis]|uniref:cobyrinate a,c-diamide synthase n=1 Tax=Hahella ganghwensis TaxID=286420 RepID=UPI0003630879|nr:cobyrinate a,c-diamide synthase [Hahella ganghwensis]
MSVAIPDQVETSVCCPAYFLAAPASGQGKTTVTAALARYLRNQGIRVRVFKTGPDYLDPQILEQASGHPVEQLDLWMAGEDYCRQALHQAAQDADLILVEGAMGIFDGEPSSADLAACFGIPVILVMDVKGMAQTAAAIAAGLAGFRQDINLVGVIANHCGSERHAQLIRDNLPESLPLIATMPRNPELALPERHLGLVQASEVRQELEERFEAGAKALAAGGIEASELFALKTSLDTGLIKKIGLDEKNGSSENSRPGKTNETKGVLFQAPVAAREGGLGRPLQGLRVGIAKDEAFSFIYAANLRLLNELGAQFEFFSPLHDSEPGSVDAIWLPGGYPELYAEVLSANEPMKEAIRQHFIQQRPILAECGGFLYCLETLTDLDENTFNMLGLIPGKGMMRGKRGCQGMQTAVLPEGEVQAHAHHRSRSFDTPEPIGYGRRQRHSAPGEPIFRLQGLTATYLHLFFPSNPEAVAALFYRKATISGDQEISCVV